MNINKRLLSVVVPVYNEEGCLYVLLERLDQLKKQLDGQVDLEFIFVNDGSSDRTMDLLLEACLKDDDIKVISLGRNFGHQIAVTAGIDHAKGDFVAIIDADLQDPPELIAEMYAEMLNGYDVVYGQRRKREGETWFKKVSAMAFYRVLNYLCEIDIPVDTGDFRLMSRKAVDALVELREHHRFIRGMIPWCGFKSKAFLYDRDERYAGETKYPLKKMVLFGTNAVLSFSKKPLQLATRLGMFAVLLGFLGASYMLYLKLFTDLPVPGITAIIISIVFMGGVQILLIGLVGEYIARIFEEVKQRPLYVIDFKKNL